MQPHAAYASQARWCRLSLVACLLWVSLPVVAQEENLLSNPGFEEVRGTMPARWEVFVQPAEGATARLVSDAHSGEYAVQLQTATPYAEDPANNWSQNLLGEYGGKRMRLSGYIKVEAADEAALWAQCWRKEPWGVVHVASTSTRAPVYGTKDWDETFVEFDVPPNTDYITVRCVLKGVGTAWFDDVSLVEIGHAKTPAPKAPESKPMPKMEEPPKRPAKSVLGQSLRDDLDALKLREENRLLRDTVDSLRTTNEDLLKRVKALEDRLGADADGESTTPTAERE